MVGGRLAGKVIVVSGGASGIGLAAGRRFVEQGATAVLADIDLAAAERVAQGHEGLVPLELDVTDDAAWARVLDACVERFGKVDGVVNNCGIFSMQNIESISLEEWSRTMRVNVDGVFLGCRHAVRVMKAHGGAIVNISSVSGLIGGRNTVAYNASKGAVRLLTKSVALHCAHRKYGIRCNSVHPTFVETPMFDAALATARDPGAMRSALLADVPLGRAAKPEEVADLLVYLVSDESQFVTGAEFVIDGGMTAS
jgi:NAD(P)-dependent dehydrogenase (short-subunit alcohol dehydrogenase family)